jgi:hypothetical protein
VPPAGSAHAQLHVTSAVFRGAVAMQPAAGHDAKQLGKAGPQTGAFSQVPVGNPVVQSYARHPTRSEPSAHRGAVGSLSATERTIGSPPTQTPPCNVSRPVQALPSSQPGNPTDAWKTIDTPGCSAMSRAKKAPVCVRLPTLNDSVAVGATIVPWNGASIVTVPEPTTPISTFGPGLFVTIDPRNANGAFT